ncbi:MAG: HNH endonuclease family protein [Alistipes sp.]
MKVELHEITIRELVDGYMNNDSEGVVGYGGRLNIRPKYQREFVYKDKQRNAVIDTVVKHFPLNVMYWAVCDDGTYEVIDGQQRTISICEYVAGHFSFDNRYFHNLQSDEQERILDYRLMVYWCSGSDSEKLKWFETINIAGERLTDQELRNAVYSGEWVSDAKRYFSKKGCAAQEMAGDYLKGSAIRQEYLETAIRWISKGDIREYMAQHQHEHNANALWLYFNQVINWVKVVFPRVRKEMKGVEWGELYNRHHDEVFDSTELESRIVQLMQDEDVTNKCGIYAYLLGEGERHLSIRAFSDKMKREAYERQEGICPLCNKYFEIGEMEGDHITPWSQGGATTSENCQMLCRACNRRKGDI